MSNKTSQARSKKELIIEVWEKLDCESVGAEELDQIQNAIRNRFGSGAVDSPASIARVLADEGAELRHPEVLNFDTVWRQNSGVDKYEELDFSSLSDAVSSIKQLEFLRSDCVTRDNDLELRRINEFVTGLSEELFLVVQSKMATQRARAEAQEVVQWLSVWRRAPDLFADWLDLRLRSNEFRRLFPDFERL